MKNFSDTTNFAAFLTWHEEATNRLRDGESLVAPTLKFFEHWRMNRLQDAIRQAMTDGRDIEVAILVDIRNEWVSIRDKKRSGRTFEAVEESLRKVYAGDSPYLTGPVSVELL